MQWPLGHRPPRAAVVSPRARVGRRPYRAPTTPPNLPPRRRFVLAQGAQDDSDGLESFELLRDGVCAAAATPLVPQPLAHGEPTAVQRCLQQQRLVQVDGSMPDRCAGAICMAACMPPRRRLLPGLLRPLCLARQRAPRRPAGPCFLAGTSWPTGGSWRAATAAGCWRRRWSAGRRRSTRACWARWWWRGGARSRLWTRSGCRSGAARWPACWPTPRCSSWRQAQCQGALRMHALLGRLARLQPRAGGCAACMLPRCCRPRRLRFPTPPPLAGVPGEAGGAVPAARAGRAAGQRGQEERPGAGGQAGPGRMPP